MEQFYNEKVLSIHLDKLLTHVTAFLLFSVKLFADAQGVTCSSATLNSDSLTGRCPPNSNIGQTCIFECKNGYIGDNNVRRFTLTCGRDGRWQGIIPICRKIYCPAVSYPANGIVEGRCDSTAVPGDVCRFRCNNLYQIVGSSDIRCNNDGTWTRNIPTCRRTGCPDIFSPSGVQTSGSCIQSQPGSVCSFNCQPGYQIAGLNSITCGPDGIWSGPVPSCTQIITCPNLQPPNQGNFQGRCTSARPGDVCTITCNPGYAPSGQNQLSCLQDGTWSSVAPTCVDNRIRDGNCVRETVSHHCKVRSDPVYTLIGADVLVCKSKTQWNVKSSVCRCICSGGGCDNLGAPVNGQSSGVCTNARPGDVCSFSCYNGFVLRGAYSSKCLYDGTWSTSVPSCISTGR